MSTHSKSFLCKYCNAMKKIRADYFHKPCRDCLSYGKSFPFYLLMLQQAKIDDLQHEIEGLRLTVQGFYRWAAEELEPLLQRLASEDVSPIFQKARSLST